VAIVLPGIAEALDCAVREVDDDAHRGGLNRGRTAGCLSIIVEPALPDWSYAAPGHFKIGRFASAGNNRWEPNHTRMQTGRWKVSNHLNDWLGEFRLYHRKDGKVVKEHDDLLCASRYAMMMKRYAATLSSRRAFYGEIKYPNLGLV
jgi:uncharacterized protein (DUF2126 family)